MRTPAGKRYLPLGSLLLQLNEIVEMGGNFKSEMHVMMHKQHSLINETREIILVKTDSGLSKLD